MAPTDRKLHATPSNGSGALPGTLRFELIDEEERALVVSHAIATALGVAFLLLIQFGPRPPIIPIEVPWNPIVFGDPPRTPTVIPAGVAKAGQEGSRRVRTAGAVTGAIGNAFSALGGASIGQPTDILGKVALTPRGSGDANAGGKTVLAYGEGGVGSMPGRGGISGGGGGPGIGGVARGRNVARVASKVGAPSVIPVAPLTPAGDAATVGTYVRGNASQLRFCYEENGLSANPRLAGSITVAITVAANGSVSAASVAKRSWAGPGSSESEACILRAIRGWRLPAPTGAQATYSFPFNFSR